MQAAQFNVGDVVICLIDRQCKPHPHYVTIQSGRIRVAHNKKFVGYGYRMVTPLATSKEPSGTFVILERHLRKAPSLTTWERVEFRTSWRPPIVKRSMDHTRKQNLDD